MERREFQPGAPEAFSLADGTPQQFHVLGESPCPYLPDRLERKLITELQDGNGSARYSSLSRAGFRRSHGFAYRPACSACTSCVPVRVVARDFVPSRSQKRVWRRNEGLAAAERPAQATTEQYRLFEAYIGSRHGDGDMALMSFGDYRSMVEDSRLDTRLTEFRTPAGRLVAACLADWLEDGPSAVYSFFDPALSDRSLGTHMVLWLIETARHRGLDYVYLGYWIAESQKMSYKARFHPIEGLAADGWQRFEAPPDSLQSTVQDYNLSA